MNKRQAKIEAYSIIQREILAYMGGVGLWPRSDINVNNKLRIKDALETISDEFSRREERLKRREAWFKGKNREVKNDG